MNVAVIGAGNVGLSLAAAFAQHEHQIHIGTREPAAKRRELDALEQVNPTKFTVCTPNHAVQDADLIVFSVPDAAIQATARELTPHIRSGAALMHCSGTLVSEILPPSHTRCSAHPLNTFPNPAAAIARLMNPEHGTAVVCEGDQTAINRISPLFEQCGFKVQQIDAAAKPLYHAASVMACNYLSVLAQASMKTAKLAGLDPEAFWLAAQPLVSATINNIDTHGAADSLSGPIVRGDAKTVANHLRLLQELDPQLAATYRVLGRGALNIAKARGVLTEKQLELLEQALT